MSLILLTGHFQIYVTLVNTKLQRKRHICKGLSVKTVALHGANMRFVGCRAVRGSEIEGGEVRFVDFAEA